MAPIPPCLCVEVIFLPREYTYVLTGDCKRVHDRHAAYRVVGLEGQLLGAGDGELPVVARNADKEVRCSLGV